MQQKKQRISQNNKHTSAKAKNDKFEKFCNLKFLLKCDWIKYFFITKPNEIVVVRYNLN